VLQRGVEVEMDPFSGGDSVIHPLYTPLLEAARHSVDAVSILLEFGVDAGRKDKELNTPLHLVAEMGRTEAVKLLVERWPEGVREKNWYLDTLLHLAAKAGKTKSVRWASRRRMITWMRRCIRRLFELWPEGIRRRTRTCVRRCIWLTMFGLAPRTWLDCSLSANRAVPSAWLWAHFWPTQNSQSLE
jgi:hypothetical protein